MVPQTAKINWTINVSNVDPEEPYLYLTLLDVEGYVLDPPLEKPVDPSCWSNPSGCAGEWTTIPQGSYLFSIDCRDLLYIESEGREGTRIVLGYYESGAPPASEYTGGTVITLTPTHLSEDVKMDFS